MSSSSLSSIQRVGRTGFYTSLISYIALWSLDLARPGFVSRYLSLHLFLLAAIVFAALWTQRKR